MTVVLQARRVCAGYGGVPVVREIDLEVRGGELVALLGPNGAGKTTTLLALSGTLPVLSGDVCLFGTPTRSALHRRARKGLAMVNEDRAVFMGLSVLDNLKVGRCDVDYALELFPELAERLRVPAGLLSGGEQQMLALGRMLARHPRVLIADELSLGLAPLVVQRLLRTVRLAADEGIAVLLVEQHVRKVLAVADRAYLMRRGQIYLSGSRAELASHIGEIEESLMSAGAHRDCRGDPPRA